VWDLNLGLPARTGITSRGRVPEQVFKNWQELSRIRQPIIAAVSGYAVSSYKKFSTPLHPLRPTILFSHRLTVLSVDVRVRRSSEAGASSR
jgi:hypothetical protein